MIASGHIDTSIPYTLVARSGDRHRGLVGDVEGFRIGCEPPATIAPDLEALLHARCENTGLQRRLGRDRRQENVDFGHGPRHSDLQGSPLSVFVATQHGVGPSSITIARSGPSHANGAVVGSDDCMLAISFSVGYMGWHGEAGHDCAPLCEGGDGASCACRRAAQVGCTDVRASLSEVHPIRGAGSSLRRRVRGAVAGAAGLAVGGVQVRSPRPVDWLGQGGHRSKCGNSSLHTRAGLSRGTQCSGSGVSNDARARQRPWISAVSARADSRAA